MRVVVELIMLDWIAKGWGKNDWTELNLLQKGITLFLLFDLLLLPLYIMDILDVMGLI